MKNLAAVATGNYKEFVQPEDTALQGCNRSAALNSNTAGRSGSIELLWAAQFLFCKFVEPQTEGGFWHSMLR